MAGEILVHSRPVQGVKLSSRIERERYRTVLIQEKYKTAAISHLQSVMFCLRVHFQILSSTTVIKNDTK